MVRAAALLLLLAAPALAQQAVWVVAPIAGPGVDFTSLQPAITAAAEGDTILVRSGSYAGFTLTGKSLALTADAGADVQLGGLSYIAGLAPGQFVSLRGFKIQGDFDHAALRLESNAGTVWIENCTLHGEDGVGSPFFVGPTSALNVQGCASVTLVHCQLTGGASGNAEGLRASSSTVHVYASTLTGGSGMCDDVHFMCTTAGDGVHLFSSFLTAQGSTITGGVGAAGFLVLPGCSIFNCIGASGGPAAHIGVGAAPSTAFLYATTLVPGPKLAGACCSFPGPATKIDPGATGTITPVSGATLDMSVSSPVREQQTATLAFTGTPGDVVSLFLAATPGDVFKAAFGGPWLLSGPAPIVLIAPVPAGGLLSVPVLVPDLPVGAESVAVALQAARISATGNKLLADSARMLLLDASF